MHDESTEQFAAELLTDPEGARLARVGMTTWFDFQKRPDFPAPIWLGPRCKRHIRARLITWMLAQQQKPREAA